MTGSESLGTYLSQCKTKILNSFSLLVVTCLLTPYQVAFQKGQQDSGMQYLDYFINSCFILDIFINFFSAYHDSDLEIIDIHRVSLNFALTLL